MKGMGKAIRRYREEAGITQERLAELVDISTNQGRKIFYLIIDPGSSILWGYTL